MNYETQTYLETPSGDEVKVNVEYSWEDLGDYGVFGSPSFCEIYIEGVRSLDGKKINIPEEQLETLQDACEDDWNTHGGM